jgi:hypothetical protein
VEGVSRTVRLQGEARNPGVWTLTNFSGEAKAADGPTLATGMESHPPSAPEHEYHIQMNTLEPCCLAQPLAMARHPFSFLA